MASVLSTLLAWLIERTNVLMPRTLYVLVVAGSGIPGLISTWTTLRRVTLPLLTPAPLGAMIYNFVNVVEWVDIPLVLGLPGHVPVLSTQEPLRDHDRQGIPAAQLPAGRWPAFAAVIVYVLIVLVLPLLMLFWSSIQPYYGGLTQAAFHRISFTAYSDLFHSSVLWSTVRNTVELGILAALGTLIISVLSSWLVVRAPNRLAGALDFLVFFPQMIPSIVIGLAILLVYLILPVGIFGTIWILVIAMTTK